MTVRAIPSFRLKDPEMQKAFEALREALQEGNGDRGNPDHKWVTVADLKGYVNTAVSTALPGPGGTATPTPTPTPSPKPTPTGDGLPPPAPTSLTLHAASFSITVMWTNPAIPDLKATEIWGRRSFSAWNSTYTYQPSAKVLVNGIVYSSRQVNNTNHPVTDTAWWSATTLSVTEKAKIGEVAGSSFEHTGLTPGETWAYWVRNHDIEDFYSDYYPNDDIGVSTTTTLDPAAYLEILTGAITATQLYSDLGSRIDLIDGSSALIGSVNSRIKTTQDALQAGQDSLKLTIDQNSSAIVSVQNVNADQATQLTGLGTRTSTSESQIATLNTTTATQATQITGLSTRTSTAESSITTLNNTTANQATSISGLSTRVSGAESSITSLNTTTANQATSLNQLSTKVDGNTSSISTLNTTTATQATSLSNLSTRVGTSESNITNLNTTTANQATSINQLSSTVGGHTTSIQQQSSSIDGLKAQYTVRIDNNGWISGFGLASTTQTDGKVISDFGIRADRFWLAPPTAPGNATGGPGIGLSDISDYHNEGIVVRIGTTILTQGGPTAYFAYVQLNEPPSSYGLNNFDPASVPANRQWISLSNVRDTLSGTKSTFWNQAWPAYGVGYFTWTDWSYGYPRTLSTASLPGVTYSPYVVVISSGLDYTAPTGYTTAVTDPAQANSDPAKLIPPNMLPFIVTTTPKYYNGTLVPAGVFMNNTFMANAMIGRAVMTGAIGSDNFVSGTSGWQIDYSGNAEFNTVLVRKPSNMGSNSIGFAQTLTGAASSSFNGIASFLVYGDYVPKAASGQTTTMVITVDIEAASTTNRVTLYFYGNDGSEASWTLYNKGQNMQQKSYSGTICYHFAVTASSYSWKVDITNNGPGVAGNPRLTLMEIVS